MYLAVVHIILTAADISIEHHLQLLLLTWRLGRIQLNLRTMTPLWGHQLNFMTYFMKSCSQKWDRITFSLLGLQYNL